MKLTKAVLKRLIKEELGRVMEMEEEGLEDGPDGPFVVIVKNSIDDSDHYSEGSVMYIDGEGALRDGYFGDIEGYSKDRANELRDGFELVLYDLGAGHEVDGGIVDSDGNPISAADMAARF